MCGDSGRDSWRLEKEVELEMEGKLLVLNNAECLEGEELVDDFGSKSLDGENGGVDSISARSSAIVGYTHKGVGKKMMKLFL